MQALFVKSRNDFSNFEKGKKNEGYIIELTFVVSLIANPRKVFTLAETLIT